MIQSNLHTNALPRDYYWIDQLKSWLKIWVPVIVARLATATALALFFVFVGTDSITDVINTSYFTSDVVVTTAISFILVSYVQAINNFLKKKYSLHQQFQKRVTHQIMLGVVLPALFTVIAISIYFFGVMNYKPEEISFFYNEFPVSIVVIAALNLFFAALSFFKENKMQLTTLHQLQEQVYTLQQSNIPFSNDRQQSKATIETDEEEQITTSSPAQKIKTLVAVSGNKNIPIAIEQIAYVVKEGNFTKLFTFHSETYLLNHALDELMKLLDDALFFRANRQCIINLNACRYFTNEENGKLALYLSPETEDEIIISQKRAAQFKEWLNG
jgi:DNA-binding LytR/AlgR family response regulator